MESYNICLSVSGWFHQACFQGPSTLQASESHSVMSDSLWTNGLYNPWNSPGQNTGLGSLSLLQGILPTQGSNPGLPHCRWILYQLSYQGSPIYVMMYVKISFLLMAEEYSIVCINHILHIHSPVRTFHFSAIWVMVLLTLFCKYLF